MLARTNPFWLLLTDSLLGIIVAGFALFLLVILIREIAMNIRYRRSRRIARDLHAFVSKHGITMADGGEPRREEPAGSQEKPTTEDQK